MLIYLHNCRIQDILYCFLNYHNVCFCIFRKSSGLNKREKSDSVLLNKVMLCSLSQESMESKAKEESSGKFYIRPEKTSSWSNQFRYFQLAEIVHMVVFFFNGFFHFSLILPTSFFPLLLSNLFWFIFAHWTGEQNTVIKINWLFFSSPTFHLHSNPYFLLPDHPVYLSTNKLLCEATQIQRYF